MTNRLEIIVIDNYDSFTYNLVDQFRRLDSDDQSTTGEKNHVVVYRNDTPVEQIFTAERLARKNCVIVISPGPGNPDSAGNSLKIIQTYKGKIPILGICLGHQAIVQSYGGVISQARQILHGKADTIFTEQHPVFASMGTDFRAARYHSLAASSIPAELEVIARSKDEVMAVASDKDKIIGFQFHPESILTTQGSRLLKTTIDWLCRTR